MHLSDFDYHLPSELIAQTPLPERTASRLLVLDRQTGEIQHRQFRDLLNLLREGDLLVFNKSRVIPARLRLIPEVSGLSGEILLIKPCVDGTWECLVRPGKKFPVGSRIPLSDELFAEVLAIDPEEGVRTIRFSGDVLEFAKKAGEMPLPPYISEKLEDDDRYQTEFSREGNSVAAPTAGLHFSAPFLEELKEKEIETAFVHLDVGLGTFRPVKTENLSEHKMHAESYSLDSAASEAVNRAKSEGRRVIAVGTTSVRVLESCASEDGFLSPQTGETSIFITPGYRFRVIDGMITNFHLPKSTLLMLVSAFAGRENVFAAYEAAVAEKYRFFSFGDAMLIQESGVSNQVSGGQNL